jgi:signal transduction histidine kinase
MKRTIDLEYSEDEREMRLHRLLSTMQRYAVFFGIIAFILTCCMNLFIRELQAVLDLQWTKEMLRRAAGLTMLNVFVLAFLWTLLDELRRYFMVVRPVRRILQGAKQVMAGDLTTRIEPVKSLDMGDGFNLIIDCFNRMIEELGGMETMRTDFIANVSHELKTPLAVMQNYGTLLAQPNLSEEQRLEYADAITSASKRLANLITNILKLNKLENQQIYPQKQTYDLGEQLCECLLSFENAWERKNLEVVTEIDEDVWVRSDPELLTLVWNNLFSNAIKFTDADGRIGLSLQREGGRAVVRVWDNGCGISPETGAHIFEKFYQGDTSHATQGNGLGLALVKRVVDIVGGEISVASAVGRGSEFTVKLAVASRPQKEPKAGLKP